MIGPIMLASGLASADVAAGLGLLVDSDDELEHPVRATTAAAPTARMAVFMTAA
jgi:hypothetical protein